MPFMHLSRSQLFWALQIAAWLSFATVMALASLNELPPGYLVQTKGLLALLGLLTTAGLRRVYRSVPHRSFLVVFWASLVGACVAGVAWSVAYNPLQLLIVERYLGRPMPIADSLSLLRRADERILVMFAWSLLYFGVKAYWTLQDERERVARAEAALAEAQLRALRYQLNPHFLFNALNAVSTLIVERRNREAEVMVSRLAEVLRVVLEGSAAAEVPLSTELDFIRQYLDIEQVRFGERLDVRYEVAPEVLTASVPSLILQPLVENAIRHAIAKRKDGGWIHIRAYPRASILHLAVADSGPGHPVRASLHRRGIGLSNTAERLAHLYGDKAALQLAPSSDGTLVAMITLPMRPGEAMEPVVAGTH